MPPLAPQLNPVFFVEGPDPSPSPSISGAADGLFSNPGMSAVILSIILAFFAICLAVLCLLYFWLRKAEKEADAQVGPGLCGAGGRGGGGGVSQVPRCSRLVVGVFGLVSQAQAPSKTAWPVTARGERQRAAAGSNPGTPLPPDPPKHSYPLFCNVRCWGKLLRRRSFFWPFRGGKRLFLSSAVMPTMLRFLFCFQKWVKKHEEQILTNFDLRVGPWLLGALS